MSTVILYSKDDARKYLSSPPLADRILPLTPNAMAELVGDVDVEILDPLNYSRLEPLNVLTSEFQNYPYKIFHNH